MAEMLLLCKEAVRRRQRRRRGTLRSSIEPEAPKKQQQQPRSSPRRTTVNPTGRHDTGLVPGTGGNKPLSLEYMADRLDIDDPCFGYLVRTCSCPPNHESLSWQAGMLQGFITATTFTNWQKSFRWDSINEAAYYDDDDPDDDDSDRRPRIRDVSGSLARELQSTVHAGNIHGEGIVWPRIAEISLLGGLGCGSTLVRALVDELETAKPTILANYDYLVLQATDNSIPFYESMGFIRVGAIMLEEDQNLNRLDENCETVAVNTPATTDDDTNVTSPVFTYEVKSAGETFTRIAAKFHVDVYDILFLNRLLLGMNARPCDKPKIQAKLLIPKNSQNSNIADDLTSSNDDTQPYVPSDEIKWHTCKENDTPRTIAKMYNVSTYDLVERNKGRLPGLISSSRLKENTKIKVSHLNVPDNLYKPYAHWSFPDSKYEDPEPSYMMVRKLNRRRKTSHATAQHDPPISFLSSLKGSIVENDISNPSLLLSPPSQKMPAIVNVDSQGHSSVLVTATVGTPYVPYSENDPMIKGSLYNKVVRLKPGAMTEGCDYTYWYVLTFIPDLQWCHLAPMIQDGTFGMDKPRAFGKTKWRLLDEVYGHEVDISAKYCIPVKSRSMKKTLDADKEEWDIIDDGTDPTVVSTMSTYRRSSMNSATANSQRGTIAIKPSTERVRKMPPSLLLSSPSPSTTSLILESPSLLAAIPGTGRITMVRLVGRSLFKQPSTTSTEVIKAEDGVKRKRGRPFGSKNVLKIPERVDEETAVGSPIGKKRRLNSPTGNIHVPASARKAAAMRTNAMLNKSRKRGMELKSGLSNQTEYSNANTTKKTLPPRRASLSSSTYTIDSPSISDGSTYRSAINTDSDTLTVASLEDDASEFEQTKPSKRRKSATSHASRRSSRLSIPSTESATPKRRTTRSTNTSDGVLEDERALATVVNEVVSSKPAKPTSLSTPPSRLPKLAAVMNDHRETTLTIRSVDLTPSVCTERDERSARRTTKTSQVAGRKLVQQNLKSMIVPRGMTKSHQSSSSTTSRSVPNVTLSTKKSGNPTAMRPSSSGRSDRKKNNMMAPLNKGERLAEGHDNHHHRPRRTTASSIFYG